MKKSELFFSFLLVPFDFIMIILAGISAYYIRYSEIAQNTRPVVFDLHFDSYLKALIVIAFLSIIIFAFSGLYSIKSNRRLTKEFYKIIQACSTGFVLIVIMIFVRRELFDSRFIILAGFVMTIIFVAITRMLIGLIQKFLFKKGIGVHKVALIGNSKTGDSLMEYFYNNKFSGYFVVKRFKDFSIESANELSELIKLKKVDEIIQSDPNIGKAETLRIIDFTDEHHLIFKYAVDLLGTKVLKTEVNEIAGIPIVEAKRTTLDGWGRIAKRIFDIIFSLFFIILLSPIIILTAICVKIDSKGPIFYKNTRIGKNGSSFKLYKFRSMLIQYCTGKEYSDKTASEYERELINKQNTKEGPVYKIENDPRVTRVGKFIRRWSIDELPQFFNVLIGNMSLIGPRPHQPREVAKYEFHHKKVLTLKPGVSGMAQISGRSDLSFEEEIKLDTYYIENWTTLFDLSILFKTPLAVIKKRKVE